MQRRVVRSTLAALASCALLAPMAHAAPAPLPAPPKKAEAVGRGGAVSSVDADATRAGIEVLRRGGSAADAAVAVAAARGNPRDPRGCEPATAPGGERHEGPNTSHLTVADASGDVVSYTLTIEQTGGSAITVPGRGFLLNNELTDFSFAPAAPGEPDPNLPGPGKRPRSSISPTIVLRDGEPLLATGSPGGATIITTVLQVLTGRLDRGMSLVDAIAEPRASQRNSASTEAEPGFLAQPEADELRGIGHEFEPSGEIGAATGVERLPDGRWVAAAEPERRGGGSAEVVVPAP